MPGRPSGASWAAGRTGPIASGLDRRGSIPSPPPTARGFPASSLAAPAARGVFVHLPSGICHRSSDPWSGEAAMKEWRARAPVRFCDLGGWTDTRIVPRGAVLNFAARLYTYVTLQIREGPRGATLESLDTEERTQLRDVRHIEYNGVLDLLKAA